MKNILLRVINSVLRSSAKRVVRRFNPTIIAVTGSVGKSSTKEAIFKVLDDPFHGDVWKSHGNLNTEIGVPLSILGFTKSPSGLFWFSVLISAVQKSFSCSRYPKFLVLELGVDKPGDMASLTEIVKPDYAIITSLTPAHTTSFPSVHAYQEEKLRIIDALKPGGKVFINYDDEVMARKSGENYKSVGITNQVADYRAEVGKIGLSGAEYRISCQGYNVSVKSKLLGAQMMYPSLFAVAVANALGISPLKTRESIEKLEGLPGRMSLIAGKDHMVIIDDTYNANPTSVKAALDFLAEIDYPKRKVAILGNMNELGSLENQSHLEIGEYAASRCDVGIFIGPNSGTTAKGFGRKDGCYVFSDRGKVVESLFRILKPADLILVKASQNGNYFEEIVKRLMKNPGEASKLLVRQSKGWMRKKQS